MRRLTLALVLVLSACGSDPDEPTPSDGIQVKEIKMPTGITANSPRFSPDGQRISFDHGDTELNDSLAVVDRDGNNLQVLADNCTTFCESAWHPTSGEIFFSRDDGVYAVAAAGGTPRGVSDQFRFPSGMDVSPDGQSLVFRDSGLVMLDIASSSYDELIAEDQAQAPRFSPEGKRIVYLDGITDSVRVWDRTNDSVRTLITTGNYLSSADWFPDGNRLAVITDDGIEILTLQEGAAEPTRQMLKKGFALKDVDVSPDGKSIAYCVNGQRSIFVLTGF